MMRMTLMRMETVLILRTSPNKHFPHPLNSKNLMCHIVCNVPKSMQHGYQISLPHWKTLTKWFSQKRRKSYLVPTVFKPVEHLQSKATFNLWSKTKGFRLMHLCMQQKVTGLHPNGVVTTSAAGPKTEPKIGHFPTPFEAYMQRFTHCLVIPLLLQNFGHMSAQTSGPWTQRNWGNSARMNCFPMQLINICITSFMKKYLWA